MSRFLKSSEGQLSSSFLVLPFLINVFLKQCTLYKTHSSISEELHYNLGIFMNINKHLKMMKFWFFSWKNHMQLQFNLMPSDGVSSARQQGSELPLAQISASFPPAHPASCSSLQPLPVFCCRPRPPAFTTFPPITSLRPRSRNLLDPSEVLLQVEQPPPAGSMRSERTDDQIYR